MLYGHIGRLRDRPPPPIVFACSPSDVKQARSHINLFDPKSMGS